MRLSDFIDRTHSAQTAETLFTALETAARTNGYAHVAYAQLTSFAPKPKLARPLPPPAVLVNYPSAWMRRYGAEGFHEIDPVVAWTAQIGGPFLWRDLTRRFSLTRRQTRFMALAECAGLDHGMTIPLHGPWGSVAAISYAGRDRAADDMALISRLQLVAHQFHHCFTQLAEKECARTCPLVLTERERECLEWVARGKTSWEIGVILGIKKATVNSYVMDAFQKLDVTTRVTAVLKAARLGLITV